MRSVIDIFVALGERLRGFGNDAISREVMGRAMAQNLWFTECDIKRAVDAICREMLDDAKLAKWLSHYTPASVPQRVAIIMAGNIPLVGFFDLLCVLCSGHQAYVKPSSKDRILMEYIIDTLRDIDAGVAIYTYNAEDKYDMAIATGGDEANAYFRQHFEGTRCLLRGSRHSVAVLDGAESDEEMQGLLCDITSYSGLGCRSVSMLFIPEGYDIALPKCVADNPKLRNNIAQRRALYTLQHRPYTDYGAFLAVEGTVFSSSLAEVTLCRYSNLEDVKRWIAEHRDELQCVVSHMDIAGCVPFGRAQYPALTDYADGVDTMQFLA